LYSYEAEIIQKLPHEKKKNLAVALNSTFNVLIVAGADPEIEVRGDATLFEAVLVGVQGAKPPEAPGF
jgi:hypothetical protein